MPTKMINVNSKAIIISIKNFVIIYSVWGINFISKLHRLCFNVIFYLIIIFFVYLIPLCYLKELISIFINTDLHFSQLSIYLY